MHNEPSRLREDGHEPRLAERLRLHAPFRHMEAKGLQEEEELRMGGLRNKRRRVSSSSSYLEPAIIDEPTEVASRLHRENHRRDQGTETRHERRRQEVPSSDVSDIPLSRMTSSPAKQLKPFERRSRHRTKEDRYVLKDVTAHVQEAKEKRRKKSTRLSRKEKTGSVLLHNFAADNVASERLTV